MLPSFSASAFTRKASHSYDKHCCCQTTAMLSETSGGANNSILSWTPKSQWPGVNENVVLVMLGTPRSPSKGQNIKQVIKQVYQIRTYRLVTLAHLSPVHRLTWKTGILSSRYCLYTEEKLTTLSSSDWKDSFSYWDPKLNKWILKGQEVNRCSEMHQY